MADWTIGIFMPRPLAPIAVAIREDMARMRIRTLRLRCITARRMILLRWWCPIQPFYKHLFYAFPFDTGYGYSFDQLDDHAIGYDFSSWQTVRIASLLAQNEWKNDQWSLLLGGRLDKHNLIDNPIFSPVSIFVSILPSQSVSEASYAGGFRAPQTFDEDLHIDMAGGERFRVHLADNLKEERSNSLSASADLYHSFGSVKTNLMAGLSLPTLAMLLRVSVPCLMPKAVIPLSVTMPPVRGCMVPMWKPGLI